MTFRPTDDVLESMEDSQEAVETSNQYNQISDESTSSDSWARIFSNPDEEENHWNVVESENITWDSPVEEVKAPDLSELLEKSEGKWDNIDSNSNTNVEQKEAEDFTVDLSEIENSKSGEVLNEGGQASQEQENSVSEVDW